MAQYNLTLCHLNIQSLLANVNVNQHVSSQYSKLDEIYTILVNDHSFDIIALSETWLNAAHLDSDVKIDNYEHFRKDRGHGRGGGLLIYVKNDIPCIRRADLESTMGCEMMCIEVRCGTNGSNKAIVCLCYRPPGQTIDEINNFIIDVQTSLDQFYSEKPDCIALTGDFNDRSVMFYEDHPTSELGNRLRDLVVCNNLFQLIEQPTHFTQTSAYILDLVITDSPGYICESGTLLPICELHHVPVYAKFTFYKYVPPSINRQVWHYNNADWEALNTDLSNITWTEILDQYMDMDTIVSRFTSTYIDTARKYIPVRNVKLRSKDKPWVTPHLRKLIRLRNRWSGRYNKTKCEEHKAIRNMYRSQVKQEFRCLKKSYFDKQMYKLNNPNISCKTFWGIAKQLYGNKLKTNIPTLIDNNVNYVTDISKANLFNEYFANQSTLPPPPPTYQLPEFQYLTDTRLSQIETTPYQVSKIMKSLKVNKAVGPDKVSNMLMKHTADVMCEPISNMFNKSLSIGVYPDTWKCANLSPVFKKCEQFIKENYRPISLLSCLSKIMERLVFTEMYEYLVSNNLLTQFNSGFKKNDSTVNQLINIVHHIYKGLDDNNDVCMVFLDVSKAFDKVCHRGLLFKLKQLGICGNLLEWLESYLTHRRQRVVVNGKTSEWCNTNAGVPQGSILGPLLFLVFINDIVDNIQSKIYIFADDTSIMRPITNAAEDFQILNRDLQTLFNWAQNWRVTFNAKKTEYMVFSLKNKPVNYPLLYLGNTQITQVDHHTHLGLTFDVKMTWRNHIHRVYTKASQRLANIKRIRYIIPRNTAATLYKSLVRPIFEYADSVYDNVPGLAKFDQLQREALLMITCGYQRTPTINLYQETGIEYLHERRKQHRLVIYFKMLNNLAPDHLTKLTTPSVLENRQRILRNNQDPTLHVIPYARTTRLAKSFIVHTTRDWNSLDPSCRSISTLAAFKKNLKFSSAIKPNHMLANLTGRAAVHHTRIRLGLSPLKHQLHSFGIISRPICENCEIEEESPIHYFLHCPKFSAQQTVLLVSVCGILPFDVLSGLLDEYMLVNCFLKGIDDVSPDTNKMLLNAVIEYIKQTNRFK